MFTNLNPRDRDFKPGQVLSAKQMTSIVKEVIKQIQGVGVISTPVGSVLLPSKGGGEGGSAWAGVVSTCSVGTGLCKVKKYAASQTIGSGSPTLEATEYTAWIGKDTFARVNDPVLLFELANSGISPAYWAVPSIVGLNWTPPTGSATGISTNTLHGYQDNPSEDSSACN